MEITEVHVHTLALPETDDRADGTQDATVVEIETDAGITGIGEAADSSPELVRAAFEAPVSHATSMGLTNVLLGRDPRDVRVLWDEMFEKLGLTEGRKGAAVCAMSAVDIALWDIVAKDAGEPLYKVLGGKHRDRLRVYASTLFPEDPDDVEHVRREARRAVEEGFTAVKFGWGAYGESHESDLALLRAARETLGAERDLMIDCGLCYRHDAKRARREIRALDEAVDLYFAEEPLYPDDHDGYAGLRDACDTRIVAGERDATTYGYKELLTSGALDALQPDVARCGGVTQLRDVVTMAHAFGVPVIPHGYSTDVLVAASAHVMATAPYEPLLEYVIEESPLRWDLLEENLTLEDGRVVLPDGPGLGVELDRDAIETYAT